MPFEMKNAHRLLEGIMYLIEKDHMSICTIFDNLPCGDAEVKCGDRGCREQLLAAILIKGELIISGEVAGDQ